MENELTCGTCHLGTKCRYAFVGFQKEVPDMVYIRCVYDDEFYHFPESPCWFPDKCGERLSNAVL